MSSFFRQGGYTSESDTESSADEDVRQTNFEKPKTRRYSTSSSDSDTDEKRVVKSHRDKRLNEIRNTVHTLTNHKKINDIGGVLADFETLTKDYDRVVKVVDVPKEGIPPVFIRSIAELEDYVNEQWEKKKTSNMNKMNAKNLGTLRQKLKKYNRAFEREIANFREHPEKYEDEIVVVEEKPVKEAPVVVAKTKPKKVAESESSSSGEDWDSSGSDESSSSSEDDEKYKNDPAARFLKKDKVAAPKKPTKVQKPSKAAQLQEQRAGDEGDEDKDDGFTAVGASNRHHHHKTVQLFDSQVEITGENVIKRLKEINANRGKKRTDKKTQVRLMNEMAALVEEKNLSVGLNCKVQFSLIAALFDSSSGAIMKISTWKKIAAVISNLLTLLENNMDVLEINVEFRDEEESYLESPFKVAACILTLIERLDDDFTEILQNTDSHGIDYMDRLAEEQTLCDLLERCCTYTEKEKHSTPSNICRAYMRRIEHLYYKFDHNWADSLNSSADDAYEQLEGNEKYRRLASLPVSPAKLYDQPVTKIISEYCAYIAANDATDRLRTRSILCVIYYLALHDDYFKARDHLNMSCLPMKIDLADVSTRILYNRAIVQLALCAFRRGLLRETHVGLCELMSVNRVRELLAQGISSQQQRPDRSKEQEAAERKRMMPYHMYINMEMIECVYYVSAMFQETPYLAASDTEVRRRMISKHFHRALKQSENNNLNGPPESLRDHIVAATKAMRYGDWRKTTINLINDKMNVKVWDLFFRADRVKAMLKHKIREECLRCYLLTYSSIYDSISLTRLVDMFHLPSKLVRSIVCKLICGDEYHIQEDRGKRLILMGSLNEPTQCLIMHRGEPSRVTTVVSQLTEKLCSLSECTERLAECKAMIPSAMGQGMTNMGGQNNTKRVNFMRNNII